MLYHEFIQFQFKQAEDGEGKWSGRVDPVADSLVVSKQSDGYNLVNVYPMGPFTMVVHLVKEKED